MVDVYLRPIKAELLRPLANRISAIPPIAITIVGFGIGMGAAVAVVWGAPWLGLWLWLVNRVLDGLDGEVARHAGGGTDLGGYLDIMADYVVYAALPLALAFQAGSSVAWATAAVLVASFYVNAASWMVLSAIFERRTGGDGSDSGRTGLAVRMRTTTIAMPAGLIEGAETIAFFTAMLLVPAWFAVLAAGMAALVVVTAAQRVWWATNHLSVGIMDTSGGWPRSRRR